MNKELRFIMDESDAPFSKNDNPYKRTKKDDLTLLNIVKKYDLELEPDSRLGKMVNVSNSKN